MAFKPIAQGTVSGAVLGTTSDITIAAVGAEVALLTNVGNQTVFWKFNTGGASATADCPIAAGTRMVVSLPHSTTKIAVIAAGAGSTLYVTPGNGDLES